MRRADVRHRERALWAIVDLTDGVLVGVRWTDVGDPGVPTVTERSLQNDVVTQLYCDKTTSLERGDWRMDFILTSSDGLRISNVRYKDRAVLESAKLVDWHVSYSTTEASGTAMRSDARSSVRRRSSRFKVQL